MSPRAKALPPDERRVEIVRAARPLLLQHGGHFTTRQVAEAAGIAEGTLFRVFPTKRALMHAVIAAAMDPHEAVADLDAIDRALPLVERVSLAMARLQRSIDEVSAVFSALFSMPDDDEDPRSKQPDPHDKAVHEAQITLLDAALERLVAPDADRLACAPRQAAVLLRSMTFATAHPHLRDPLLTNPRTLAELMLNGLFTKED